MLDFLIFAATFAVFLLCLVFYLYPGSRKSTTVPGMDPSDPNLGNLGDISQVGNLHEFLMDLHKEHGEIVSFWWGRQLTVSIASPALFRETRNMFDRPPELFALFQPLMTSHSIQYANKADGRQRRADYDPVFSHASMIGYHETFQKNVNELCKKLQSIAKNKEHAPLMEYMFALAIKTASQAAFGDFFNDKTVLDVNQRYQYLWGEMEAELNGDQRTPGGDREKRFQAELEKWTDMVKSMIAHRRKNPPAAGIYQFIDVLLEKAASEDVIIADTTTMMVASFHTTGLFLTWSLYFLMTHEDVYKKTIQEIKDVLGDKDVTPDTLKDLVYLRQVLDETLRCSVLAPWAARFQDIDIELAGHKIPANTPIIQALGCVLQNEELYPQPKLFDPERFSPKATKDRKNFAFEPFGFAGKRKCPGYRFSYVETTVSLVTLLQRFKFLMVSDQVVVPEYGLVTKPKDEIWVTVEKLE